MGIIRILLAISVILTHSGPIFGFNYIDGLIAVQSFFIISGFYMSLILNEKYNGVKSYKLFISNRLLRLFPTYLFIIIITLIMAFVFNGVGVKQDIFSGFSKVNFFSKIYLIFINILIVGQDTTLFLGFDLNGSLHYIKDFHNSIPPVYTFLLCPQAWSLSLELMFYAIAPFIVKRKLSTILIIMVLLFILRILIYLNGFYYDPWTYRFFPTELFFFLSGNIAYRIYKYTQKIKFPKEVGIGILICLLLFLFVFNYIPVRYFIKQYAFYILFTLSIPFIFNYTKKFLIDRFIGELSYPVYISHIFIIAFCLPILYHFFGYNSSLSSILAVVCSIIFSYLVIIFLVKRIDNYREKRVEKFNLK
jgi:peptidoglycan/LPS O-acetylase OafA/YrhL